MGWSYSTCGRDIENAYKFRSKEVEERDHLIDLSIDRLI